MNGAILNALFNFWGNSAYALDYICQNKAGSPALGSGVGGVNCGMYGGSNYHFNGHWSWIYSHANQSHTEYDGSEVLLNGKPTTVMEWLAAQAKK